MRRNKPYVIQLANQREPHRLAAWLWHHYLRQGWIRAVSRRAAILAPDVVGYLEAGTLRLVCTRRPGVSIDSSWRLVERAALYSPRAWRLTAEERTRAIQEQYAIR